MFSPQLRHSINLTLVINVIVSSSSIHLSSSPEKDILLNFDYLGKGREAQRGKGTHQGYTAIKANAAS